MTKVTDEQILALKTNIDIGKVQLVKGCKAQGITPTTYYRRLKALLDKNETVREIVKNVNDELPATIQTIQNELQTIISELKSMKGKDTREQLGIMDRKINALDKLNNTLKSTQIMIDNRTLNVSIGVTAEQWEMMWKRFIDPAMRKRGIAPDKIAEVAGIIDAEIVR